MIPYDSHDVIVAMMYGTGRYVLAVSFLLYACFRFVSFLFCFSF